MNKLKEIKCKNTEGRPEVFRDKEKTTSEDQIQVNYDMQCIPQKAKLN